MKVHFQLNYATQFGENLFVEIETLPEKTTAPAREFPLTYLDETRWHGGIELDLPPGAGLQYRYGLRTAAGEEKFEWGERWLAAAELDTPLLALFDYWNPTGAVENTFESQAFRVLLPQPAAPSKPRITGGYTTHIFKVKTPALQPDEVVCLLGHGVGLRAWDTTAPLLLQPDGDYGWSLPLDLSREAFPLAYKYGIWNTRTHSFLGFESGGNRALYPPQTQDGGRARVILHDGFARLPLPRWRGAGVAIPVFSLRSAAGFGIGEFTDLPALADWAKAAGLKLIQLLPINDTTATHTWTDSYPYAAISAFALHPIYLNLAEVAGKAQAALLKPYTAVQKKLNALETVDYEAVLQNKWAAIRQLYAAQKTGFQADAAFQQYFTENRHWLAPYAAFCYLRDQYGSSEFTRWPEHRNYAAAAIEKLIAPGTAWYDEVAIHYFVQWHLHRQLKAAAGYIHAQGLALKGDIPIGIYRYSCDAWVAPELYNMDMQAGAPPDDFAVNGQNWGFPTYNWERMKANGFAWWRQRFEQMSAYFDAFRIDHILGFFRIWSIPLEAVEGILGYFVPALHLSERDFHEAGTGFDHHRLCQPFINEAILQASFGDRAGLVREQFLQPTPDAGHWSGLSPYGFKPAFDSQRKIADWFDQKTSAPESSKSKRGAKTTAPDIPAELRQPLIDLVSNVILIDVTPAGAREKTYAFRIGMDNTSAFAYLP
ncbi:MAG: 4-alpha-glucanotransferase [Saprospiraceae bacterium]|nr:4-alpha-glucanotransferase [Saprospiraceae bacterium]